MLTATNLPPFASAPLPFASKTPLNSLFAMPKENEIRFCDIKKQPCTRAPCRVAERVKRKPAVKIYTFKRVFRLWHRRYYALSQHLIISTLVVGSLFFILTRSPRSLCTMHGGNGHRFVYARCGTNAMRCQSQCSCSMLCANAMARRLPFVSPSKSFAIPVAAQFALKHLHCRLLFCFRVAFV